MQNYLKRYSVELETIGPVHIGSGKQYEAKEYINLNNNGAAQLYLPDMGKLYAYLVTKGKGSTYEQFLQNDIRRQKNARGQGYRDLGDWLKDNSIKVQPEQFGGYTLDLPEFVNAKQRRNDRNNQGAAKVRLNALSEFIKDGFSKPYVPGSSLKGVIRTAILGKLIANLPDDKKRAWVSELLGYSNPKDYSAFAKNLETELLHSLRFNDSKQADAVNSIMRAISVSDSDPLKLSNLTVCQKIDAVPYRENRNGDAYWGMPLFRECVKPDTKIRFVVTVDDRLLTGTALSNLFDNYQDKDGNTQNRFEALVWNQYSQYYRDVLQLYKLHLAPYEIPLDELSKSPLNFLYFGGGTGLMSKTLWMSLIANKEQRTQFIEKWLTRSFAAHHHENDLKNHEVSPRCVKLTLFNGNFYEMGKCRIKIEEL